MILSGLLVTSILAGTVQGVLAIDNNATSNQGGPRPNIEMSERRQSGTRKTLDDIISRTLLTSDSFSQEDLDDLVDDGYQIIDLRLPARYNKVHIPDTNKIDKDDLDIKGGNVVFIIDGRVVLQDVQKIVNKYQPENVEIAPIEKFEGELQDITGKKVTLDAIYNGEQQRETEDVSGEVREAQAGPEGRTPPNPRDLVNLKKPSNNVVRAEVGRRSGEVEGQPNEDTPQSRLGLSSRATGELLEETEQNDEGLQQDKKLQDLLEAEISKINKRIETLIKESNRLQKRLHDSIQQTINESKEDVEDTLTDDEPEIVEGTAGLQDAVGGDITEHLNRLEQLEDETHSQYAVYLGDGLFLGLGGSAFATVGETIVHINEDEDVDLQLGGLYHFSTNGMVMMSYPSQINGKDIEQITEPVSFEVSRNILKGINNFKKDINIELVNVGKFKQVDGETKVTLGDIYSTKRVEDKNKILVVVGESRVDVERASQMLLERGARVVIKVTNFVHVDDDFEQNVKEDLERIEEELDSFIEEGKQFDIKDAAPDAIYYA